MGPDTFCVAVIAEDVDTMNDADNSGEHARREDAGKECSARWRKADVPKQPYWQCDEDDVGDEVRCLQDTSVGANLVSSSSRKDELGDALANSIPPTAGPRTHCTPGRCFHAVSVSQTDTLSMMSAAHIVPNSPAAMYAQDRILIMCGMSLMMEKRILIREVLQTR